MEAPYGTSLNNERNFRPKTDRRIMLAIQCHYGPSRLFKVILAIVER